MTPPPGHTPKVNCSNASGFLTLGSCDDGPLLIVPEGTTDWIVDLPSTVIESPVFFRNKALGVLGGVAQGAPYKMPARSPVRKRARRTRIDLLIFTAVVKCVVALGQLVGLSFMSGKHALRNFAD